MARLKVVLFIALAAISFCGFLISLLPASLFFALLPAEIKTADDLVIGQPLGTIWSGNTTIAFRNFPPSSVQWQFDGISINNATPAARYHLQITGPHHEITAGFTLSESQMNLHQLRGSIHADDINQLSAEYGHHFSGELVFYGVSLTTNFHCLQSLAGQIDWDGGSVMLNVKDPPLRLELPPMTGFLDSTDCNASLAVKAQSDNLMIIHLQPSGWVEVQIFQTMLSLAGLSEPRPASKDQQPVLLFEEKIL